MISFRSYLEALKNENGHKMSVENMLSQCKCIVTLNQTLGIVALLCYEPFSYHVLFSKPLLNCGCPVLRKCLSSCFFDLIVCAQAYFYKRTGGKIGFKWRYVSSVRWNSLSSW